MPLTPAQIKDKLTNALDDDKNVVDEEAVEEVITLLETSSLTKEILEQTRLGRDINYVRKTSKIPATAKRARNLVKAWQRLFVVPGSPQVANGQHPNVSSSSLQRISPGLQRVSPGLSPAISRSNTPVRCAPSPALAQVRQQQRVAGSRSPAAQVSKLSQKLQRGSDSRSPAVLRSASNNHDDSNLSWPGTPPCPPCENSQDRLAGDRDSAKPDASGGSKNCQAGGTNERHFNFDHKSSDHSLESTSKLVNRASDQRDVSKTNVANRKRTRAETRLDDSESQTPSSKQVRLTSSSPSLSAPVFSKSDVINGTVLRKSGRKSPAASASTENLFVDHKTMVSSSNKGSLLDQPEPSTPLSRANKRLALQRQDSVSSRLSVQSTELRTRERTNKVKTTEQLIEDMQGKSTTPVGTQVIAQIRTNKIQQESDYLKPVLPPGVKRRGRKKKQEREQLELPDKESASDGRKLAQTKSEYIKRFLQTSVAPTPGEDIYEAPISQSRHESLEEQPIGLGGCSTTFAQSAYDSNFPSYPSRQDKSDSGPSASPPEARDILEGAAHHLPSSSCGVADVHAPSSERLSEEQILARLPPIDFDNIDWASHDYPSLQPMQVGSELVVRLHSENMEGVNGTYDRDGQFRQWAELLTVDSVYDEPLYILPYVIPDD
ncbi:mediator of RNA polymerase II transcription subunit 26 [Aplysia californica]|uniref:Mediator of RNA polymerase II transcription subunit 26 n=1 Tax=Aplysia californica TaxID=6500 RepID=A0ABM0JQL2_APLCA|nr:mediator of RNA polymerase II transcription subunit 26 [Aplysia californica]